MVTRLHLILAMAGMVVIGIAGCSSAPHPGALTPTSIPVLHTSLTPSVPRAPRVGDVAPDFALDTVDGTRMIHLSDFRSKAVLLFFWSTTCSSCVKELPILQRFSVQQQAVGKQMVLLGVDLDKVSDFVKVASFPGTIQLSDYRCASGLFYRPPACHPLDSTRTPR
jgi:thiol-disulfide isomerase/thioredoxin